MVTAPETSVTGPGSPNGATRSLLSGIRDKMLSGGTDEEIDQLEEASALKDIAHMPARVKCAVLGWHTLEEALKNIS